MSARALGQAQGRTRGRGRTGGRNRNRQSQLRSHRAGIGDAARDILPRRRTDPRLHLYRSDRSPRRRRGSLPPRSARHNPGPPAPGSRPPARPRPPVRPRPPAQPSAPAPAASPASTISIRRSPPALARAAACWKRTWCASTANRRGCLTWRGGRWRRAASPRDRVRASAEACWRATSARLRSRLQACGRRSRGACGNRSRPPRSTRCMPRRMPQACWRCVAASRHWKRPARRSRPS